MALDGITIAGVITQLNKELAGGRVDKVYQPENDEIALSIRSIGNNYKLLLSANASHPRAHITKAVKENPSQPPVFCMVLRKHLTGGKIIGFRQPDFERVIHILVESANEMGDMTVKTLIIEIMGKHSNIILIDDNRVILDSIKRVSHDKSSVREVLPGKLYENPPSQGKADPQLLSFPDFTQKILSSPEEAKIQKWIYERYTGISPVMSSEICHRSGISSSTVLSELSSGERERLYGVFRGIMDDVSSGRFVCEVIIDSENTTKLSLLDFSVTELTQYGRFDKKRFDNPSEMLEYFYIQRDASYHMMQKSQDLRKLISLNIERVVKKQDIQQKTLADIENRDKWRLYGELLTANVYAVQKGAKSFRAANFYSEDWAEIEIPLDSLLTPSENAQKYFKRYNKEKRTFEALQVQIQQSSEELAYLETVMNAAQSASDEADLNEIRQELADGGYVKRKAGKKSSQKQKKSKPMEFTSSDGFAIFVGKSNTQNDELTMKFAAADDVWLHTKEIPGSHVIIKTGGETVPDKTLEEAANLAAYYSKARESSLVPVDYAFRKYVKKPNGARPGMVIYDSYKTVYITPSEIMVNGMKG